MNNIDALGLTILPDGCGERPEWVPADPPEPDHKGVSDPEEVCPEFTHTGYCPDNRLCERGCKHEPAPIAVFDHIVLHLHRDGSVTWSDQTQAEAADRQERDQ